MRFTASRWLLSFALDALGKSALIAFIGMAITSTSPFPFIWSAVSLSIFHFFCLFLGFTAVVSFELVRIKFGPSLSFWLALLFANLLFGFAVNSVLTLNTALTLSEFLATLPITGVLVATNLFPILLVAACSRMLSRIRRWCVSRTSA